jgi:hypothetical protein
VPLQEEPVPSQRSHSHRNGYDAQTEVEFAEADLP